MLHFGRRAGSDTAFPAVKEGLYWFYAERSDEATRTSCHNFLQGSDFGNMTDPQESNHWDVLASELGATPAPPEPKKPRGEPPPDEKAAEGLNEALMKVEREKLQEAVRRSKTTREAARFLGISQSTVTRKLKKHGLALP